MYKSSESRTQGSFKKSLTKKSFSKGQYTRRLTTKLSMPNCFKDKANEEFHNKRTAEQQEHILTQTDKSFVLCIDPETKLPFMINMGLKTADICDLDDRPAHIKENDFNSLHLEA